MKTYRIVAHPNVRLVRPGLGTPLTEELLVGAIAGLTVLQLREDQHGHHIIGVKLERPTEVQALEEIIGVLENLGFYVLEATVSEWVNEVLERAVIGLLGGAGVGAAAENAVVAIVAGALGAFVGGLSGAAAHKLKAEYEARRDPWSRWAFTEIPQPPPAGPGFEPGISPAPA